MTMKRAEADGLRGKVAVITGASSGIGEAVARAFAERGATVVLVARTRSTLDGVASTIAASGGKVLAVPVDIGDPAAAASLTRLAMSGVLFHTRSTAAPQSGSASAFSMKRRDPIATRSAGSSTSA